MGQFQWIVGLCLAAIGLAMVAVGLLTLGLTALRCLTSKRAGGEALPKSVTADAAKLIDALSKAPLWLAAVAVGDAQVWFGLALLSGKLPFVA